MTDPDAVARALSRLVSGASPIRDQPPERIIDDAETAMERVDAAAAFVASGGEHRLRDATERARTAGNDALAARGEAVLASLRAFRRAARGDDEPSGSVSRSPEPVPPRSHNALPGRGRNADR